jgi:RNA polymerase sigma-70 factor (ECF subfamily)
MINEEVVAIVVDLFALRAIRRGDGDALAGLIDKYGAYVSAVVRGIAGGSEEDIEEVVSDVFLALWHNAERPDPMKLKAYLGGIARNKAKNKLRKRTGDLPLEDDCVILAVSGLEESVIARSERQAVKLAVLGMNEPDREIFLRHYYGMQTVQAIAREMRMGESAVKQRLARGREKLRTTLIKEVINHGKANLGHYGLC